MSASHREREVRLHPLNKDFTWTDKAPGTSRRLTPEQRDAFNESGFVRLDNIFAADEIEHVTRAIDPLEAEGELVAVIGQPARHVTRDQARAAVLGWSIGNDVSARAWQHTDRTFSRAKNSDSFKPFGPYIVTGADPLAGRTTVRVDGQLAASFATGDMLFDPYEFIAAMSRYITLRPGDVVWLGTDQAAAIVPGQVVGISIDGLGTLSNPVVEEKLP